MKYKYVAVDENGNKQEGYVKAESRRSALSVLKNAGLKVRKLENETSMPLLDSITGIFQKVKAKDFVIFSRQLATLIDSNVPLLKALSSMSLQTENKFLALKIQVIMADVEGGASLSEALKKHKDTFSDFYVNMVKAGEVSGNLQGTLNDLADNIEKNYDLTSKLKGAMYYPAFIFSTMIVVGFLMMAFVIPELLEILKDTDATLPLQTIILIKTSDFFAEYWWAIGVVLIGAAFGLSYYLKTDDGKREFDQIVLKVPIINKILKNIYVARFAENLTSLLKSGLTINMALMITADVVGNDVYKRIIIEATDNIKKGGNIADTFGKYDLFPPMVVQMLQVGESTGKIDYSLSKITDFYIKESDNLVKNFSSLIEPIIMIILAIGVGILVSAILLPIYQVATNM
ncbi:MAG: type II secretion system F family protein [Candidatus Moraniibacteriota bacterium]